MLTLLGMGIVLIKGILSMYMYITIVVLLQLVVIYNDHSLYIWYLKNTTQIGKTNSCLYHNACIYM